MKKYGRDDMIFACIKLIVFLIVSIKFKKGFSSNINSKIFISNNIKRGKIS